jgi:hypothetical protein
MEIFLNCYGHNIHANQQTKCLSINKDKTWCKNRINVRWIFEKGNKVMVKHDYKIVTFICRVKRKGQGFTKITVMGGGAKRTPNSYNTCP